MKEKEIDHKVCVLEFVQLFIDNLSYTSIIRAKWIQNEVVWTRSNTQTLPCFSKGSIHSKKKSCELSQLWSWPPTPRKLWNLNFFFTPWPENHYMQNKKNSPLKTQKNFEKSQYLVDNHLSFQSILVRGYPYPLYRKILLQIWMN